jgi:hypothetical protein
MLEIKHNLILIHFHKDIFLMLFRLKSNWYNILQFNNFNGCIYQKDTRKYNDYFLDLKLSFNLSKYSNKMKYSSNKIIINVDNHIGTLLYFLRKLL